MDSPQKNPDQRLRPTEVEPEFGAGLREKRLRHLRSIGGGPAYTKAGKLVFYKRADIEDWLDRNRVDPSQPPAPTNTATN